MFERTISTLKMVVHKSRDASLQFWPRKRARKILPSANWNALVDKKKGLQGFVGYKVGMVSVFAKDNTNDSLTKGKKIILPGTILECPKMKIFSVRLYKNGQVAKDVVVGFDDELKSRVRKPASLKKFEDIKGDFDDLRIVMYSKLDKTGLNTTPELVEAAIGGSKEEKLNFVKENVGKDISISEIFPNGLVDVHGVTKGHGLQGPVRRFHIGLKKAKSEKGQRRPGSLGPWHPARVTFRVAMSGQTGYFTREVYNNLILRTGTLAEKDINRSGGFMHYGNIKSDYLVLNGSVPGPAKRPLLLTPALRPTKSQIKRQYQFLELR